MAAASIADRPSMCGYEIQPSRMLSLRFSFDWQPFLEAMLFNGMLIKRHGQAAAAVVRLEDSQASRRTSVAWLP
jgi:hypothetical protein